MIKNNQQDALRSSLQCEVDYKSFTENTNEGKSPGKGQ